ncbi:MAG: hypothetical protein J6S67_13885 [Methanobrevibacter sp.]|nr:hypothetical protein [Methanobrevibacter sp.]
MFEKDAEERGNEKIKGNNDLARCSRKSYKDGFKDGAEFGYNKANEWHKVSDKLPEMDVLVYLWNNIDDFPVVACRHIPYGQKKWFWDCKWGSGFTVSQLAGEDYLWKEIVLPKESE